MGSLISLYCYNATLGCGGNSCTETKTYANEGTKKALTSGCCLWLLHCSGVKLCACVCVCECIGRMAFTLPLFVIPLNSGKHTCKGTALMVPATGVLHILACTSAVVVLCGVLQSFKIDTSLPPYTTKSNIFVIIQCTVYC